MMPGDLIKPVLNGLKIHVWVSYLTYGEEIPEVSMAMCLDNHNTGFSVVLFEGQIVLVRNKEWMTVS